jgi:transcriptional antiterminator RfaH
LEITLAAMEKILPDLRTDFGLSWFCVRSRTRQEHIAAAGLRRVGIEVMNPRIRFRRVTARGPIWVIESMFPGYVFARFNLKRSLDSVRYSFGVAGVVHFGIFWPVVPEDTIETLRTVVGEEEVRLVEPALNVGDEVEVATGAFSGFHGVVTRIMPARDRVAVLLDFLGRQTTVELPLGGISHDGPRYRLNAA